MGTAKQVVKEMRRAQAVALLTGAQPVAGKTGVYKRKDTYFKMEDLGMGMVRLTITEGSCIC